ncbi:hypothetical protein [Falsiroseomonas stagni]|uniref:Uncharacterized protein n=1 Tax=Falsiroseomonas stagni DSM 19981 TaxID=1123062 RepID=A0A1I4D1E0_9PROT|nr:hypothetical protein [Falsiroseomonas stagni]SFK87312.1 hypothetical protein SAMN02745775_10977 [Falsiroseomonas stagni DSM 19981]
MDEKARLKRLGIGAAATLVLTILAATVFGSIAVPLALAVGLGATLLLGGGLGKK